MNLPLESYRQISKFPSFSLSRIPARGQIALDYTSQVFPLNYVRIFQLLRIFSLMSLWGGPNDTLAPPFWTLGGGHGPVAPPLDTLVETYIIGLYLM